MLVHDLGVGTGEHGSACAAHFENVSVIKQFTDSWCVLVAITVSLTLSEEGLEPLSICRGTKTRPRWSTV